MGDTVEAHKWLSLVVKTGVKKLVTGLYYRYST